jgi:transposase-like protein
MARPNPLNDPAYAKQVAEAFVAGLSRPEMCEMFGVKDPDTITRWRRDPRVKAHAWKLVEDRILRVTRRVDASIEARLENAENMTVKELLDIRKEFLGGALRSQTEKADEATVNEAMEAIEDNPDIVVELEALLAKGQKPGQSQE